MRGISLRLGPALVVAILVAAGCGDDDTSTVAGTTTAPATTGATTTSVVDDVQLLILLTPDGLGFTTEGSGSVSRIDFGSDQQLTRDTVVKSLGEPTDESAQDECPPGPAEISTFDGIALTSIDGVFVGWELTPGSSQSTVWGLGLGTTVADLDAAVEIKETTLGSEFSDGDIHGLVSDDSPTGTVTALWAGTVCVFR